MKKSEDYNGYMREYMARAYHKRIEKAIADAGGKCVICGSVDGLQFDHMDPGTKVANITTMYSASVEKFQTELAKCQLLCEKCHSSKTLAENGLSSAVGTHGTLSAYRYCGPPKCDACREANNEYMRKWKLEHGRVPGSRSNHMSSMVQKAHHARTRT